MKKARRQIYMKEIQEKQNKLSELFHAQVCVNISSINKGNIDFFSDSIYSGIAKTFLKGCKMIYSPKNRIMVSFIVSGTEFPHNELFLNKRKIARILKTNYLIHEINKKPCITYFLLPNRIIF